MTYQYQYQYQFSSIDTAFIFKVYKY